jgi:Zn-dependent protease
MPRYSPRDWIVLILIGLAILYAVNPGILTQPGRIDDAIYDILVRLVVLAISITIHEFGHAAVAYYLGDYTPKHEGRVSLNPLRHLDPLGTLMILVGPLGWGKPVRWNPANIDKTNIRVALIAVSLAGIAMNLLLSFALYQGLLQTGLVAAREAREVVVDLIQLNLALAAFNILPIPPLDGYNFWLGVLPPSMSRILWPLNQYGFIILILLVMLPSFGGPNLLFALIGPVLRFFTSLVTVDIS